MIAGNWQKKVVLLFLIVAGAKTLMAQDIRSKLSHLFTPPLNYIAYRSSDKLIIDGKPAEKSWQRAPWSTYFVDIEGNEKPSPEFRTRFKMLWDDQFLYVLAELEEPHIWANLREHDQIIYHDNDFEIFIDPDGDASQYFEIEVNAFGTIFDLFMSKPYRNGGRALISWNVDSLKTGVDIDGTLNDPSDTDKKWCVEMAIPLEAVSIGSSAQVPEDGSVWRINFSRVQWETDILDNVYKKKVDPNTNKPLSEHNWVWSPQGIINMHMPERWGYLQFSSRKAGDAEVAFDLPDAEPMKSHLWLVYHLQADHFRKNGEYAKDLKTLGLGGTFTRSYHSCDVLLEATSYQFTAILQCEPLKEAWRIDENGYIRKFDTNKRQ